MRGGQGKGERLKAESRKRGAELHPSSFILHPFLFEPCRLEEEGYARGFQCIAGLDEAGRGPWAGPVVAAAVVLPRGLTHPDINDSKLLSPRQRENLAPWIKENAVAWGVGIVDAQEIDRINILKASLLAMAHALKRLRPTPDYLLIDGPHEIPGDFLKDKGGGIKDKGGGIKDKGGGIKDKGGGMKAEGEDSSFIIHPSSFPFQRAIKKGDRLSLSIAAASIIAKVTRDQIMMDYDRLYPEYGFGRHKGYGSLFHRTALHRSGPSPIHRRSFKPVQQWQAEIIKG